MSDILSQILSSTGSDLKNASPNFLNAYFFQKKGVENYRSITLLSAIPKILESLIFDSVYAAFSNIIIEEQHGFVQGRFAVTNFSIFTSIVISNLLPV